MALLTTKVSLQLIPAPAFERLAVRGDWVVEFFFFAIFLHLHFSKAECDNRSAETRDNSVLC